MKQKHRSHDETWRHIFSRRVVSLLGSSESRRTQKLLGERTVASNIGRGGGRGVAVELVASLFDMIGIKRIVFWGDA